MKTVFLIDGDNNINYGLKGIEMLGEENQVMIFHSKAMEITKFKKKLSGCRAKIDFIESVRSGKNSLDFQITTELGFLSQQKDLEYAYIISCDKGYDAAVDYVKNRYCSKFKELDRRETIFDCFQLAFLLKTKNKQELNNALVKEYGADHGALIYDHLKNIFGEAEAQKPEETKETKEKAEIRREAAAAKSSEVFVLPIKMQETEKNRLAEEKKNGGGSKRSRGKGNSSVLQIREERDETHKKKEKRAEEIAEAAVETVAEAIGGVQQQAKQSFLCVKNSVKELVKTEETKEKEKGQAKPIEIPLRFDSVRTEEQKKTYYQSKDLRKKTKPVQADEKTEQKEASKKEPPKKEEPEVFEAQRKAQGEKEEKAVVQASQKKSDVPSAHKKGNQKKKAEEKHTRTENKIVRINQPPAHKNTEKRSETKADRREGEISAKRQQKAAVGESGTKKPASGNNGFFGRVFGKKKRR